MLGLGYLRNLIRVGSGESSKSFALVLSAIVGAIIGLCICFVLIFDVVKDGVVTTNMADLGILLLCDGIFMFGGGASKVISEGFYAKVKESFNLEKAEVDAEEELEA